MGKRWRGTEGQGRIACCRFHCGLDFFLFIFFGLFGLGSFRLAKKAHESCADFCKETLRMVMFRHGHVSIAGHNRSWSV